jgi:hypothetical protein
MFWVDGVMRAMKVAGNSNEVDLRYILRKMKNYLSRKSRDGNGAGTGRVEHTHARPDMGSV